MTYAEECLIKAQLLIDAANGVEFQLKTISGEWVDVQYPDFNLDFSFYRKKPKKIKHSRVVLWTKSGPHVTAQICESDAWASILMANSLDTEIKRETIYVEVNDE